MAIILNVEIVLIRSGSKVTTYIPLSAYCFKTRTHYLLNTCEVLELSRQVCWRQHDVTEVVKLGQKEKSFGRIVGEAK